MTHIDNSQNMSVEQVKEHLTNLINKQAKKVASEGNYDRTILATIQYCSNAVLGQYKIKYQNGYYSAYALDTSIKYNDGAAVYVTVPGNDLSNRLFIQGLATDDSTQKTYLTNLEGDQQYVTTGPNFITDIYYGDGKDSLGLSSYWDMTEGREVMYYNFDWIGDPTQESNNIITLLDIAKITHAIRNGDGFIRFGGEFKTNLPDDRKLQGDYGIRLVLVFDKTNEATGEITEYTETYELNTFRMDGTPFEFNEFAQRYEYYEIDKTNFRRVQSISAFVKGFPQAEQLDENYRDIFIRNISIYSALKMYDSNTDDYVVKVLTPSGTLFGLDNSVIELPFEALFTVRGNEVAESQNAQYYWAKKNVDVNSVGDSKYLNYFGTGWQCLNKSEVTKTDKSTITEEDLKNCIIDSTDYPAGYVGVLKWVSAKSIGIPKSLCKGRETVIKCCVVYENQAYYSREYTITNYDGYYLMLTSSSGETTFYSGDGSTSIVAGVFKNEVEGSGDAATYKSTPTSYSVSNPISQNIVYRWEIVNNGVSFVLPTTTSSILYKSQPFWRYDETLGGGQDSVDTDMNSSNNYLRQKANDTGIDETLLRCCIERFNYYNNWLNEKPKSERQESQYDTVLAKKNDIVNTWKSYLDNQFNASFDNSLGLYVLGPSNVTAKYNPDKNESVETFLKRCYDAKIDPLDAKADAVSVDNINFEFGYSRPYPEYEQNTLYQFQASNIIQQATIRVTALYKNGNSYEALETKEIYLDNKEGSGLEYDLEIVNGDVNFMYSGGGLAPNVMIRPLSYRLYGPNRSLIFDSSSDESDTVVTQTKPKWSFYRNSSLLTTKYSEDLSTDYLIDSDLPGKVSVLNRAKFDYGIAEEYNVNYKERSNVELTVTYQDQTYTASTHFTFSKQGDLGTNGTNKFLDIEDPTYEQYRSDVLTNKMYSIMTDGYGAEIATSPNERHLENTYMYATRAYINGGDGQIQEVTSFDEGNFLNLRFAHGATEDQTKTPVDPMHFKVVGSTTTTVYGYWYENSTHTLINGDTTSKWSLTDTGIQKVKSQNRPGRSPIYDLPSFTINPQNGSSTTLELTPPTGIVQPSGNPVYYKPMDMTYTQNMVDYEWTANNVLQCEASTAVPEIIDPSTGNAMTLKNYGYYQVPFFFYAHYQYQNGVYINDTPDGLDPARHFVITGGYDEIIYGADGLNPQYNKQDPFTINVFDEKGNDITKKVFDSSGFTVTWNTSYGFTRKPIVNGAPHEYNGVDGNGTRYFPAGQNLFNKYCIYQGKKYKCTVPHTPDQYVADRNDQNEVIKEYNKNASGNVFDFVTPYWTEVENNYFSRTQKIEPPSSYDACASESLFNSWISIKLTYIDSQTNDKIEAAALLPINILCNPYGSDEINGWDGKKTKVDDGYILTNKVGAGIKDDSNMFTGITIGKKLITNGTADQNEVGLFGYGRYRNGNTGRTDWGQTIFLDAKTGLAAFGPAGSSQIILNPKIPEANSIDESWSRLAGWYFSPNYLYKPLWADDNYTTVTDYYHTNPPDADGTVIPGSIGFYVPSSEKAGQLTKDTVFMWASAAGVSSSTFDDDGSLTALQNVVRAIKVLMQSEGFPYVYPTMSIIKEVVPEVITNSTISNYTSINETYADETSVITPLYDYQTTWLGMISEIQSDNEGRSLYHEVNDLATELIDMANESTFPHVVRDGFVVKPVVEDGITIENYDELMKWYVNSNEPNVTIYTDVIEAFATVLQQYNTKYYQLVHYMYHTLTQSAILMGQKLARLQDAINTAGVRFKTATTWDTSNPYVFSYNLDKVTIDNRDVVGMNYLRPAYTATEEQKTKLTNLNNLLTDYDTLHARYLDWQSQYENQGTAISYKDSNSKKMDANFYITYGGKMKCNNAEVDGKITATSGSIGKGTRGTLEIATYQYDSETQRNQYYLLYNPVFQVKGSDEGTATEPSVFIDGTIRAKSGQIGKTGNVDGEAMGTLFIEYAWYPWHLPSNNQGWDKLYLNKDAGRTKKYALYHRNFYITDDGEVAIGLDKRAKIYTKEGRIGDWVITTHELRDIKQHIVLDPADNTNPDNARASQIKLGHNPSNNTWNLRLIGDGSIEGPDWSITAGGVATFSNSNNEFTCKVIHMGSSTLTDAAWDLPANSRIKWGSQTLSINDNGFNFSGSASFTGHVNFEDDINLNSGKKITVSNTAVVAGDHIYFTSGYGFYSNGNAKFGTTEFGTNSITSVGNVTSSGEVSANVIRGNSIYIGNQSLTAYIQSVVQNMTFSLSGVTGYEQEDGSHHYHNVTVS